MKTFFLDFKKFIKRGNILDLAIAVSVGTAFTKIASSLVNDLIMPFISLIIGKDEFVNLKIVLRQATEDTAAITFNYGNFLQVVTEFFIIALAIFITIKLINRSRARLELLQQKGFYGLLSKSELSEKKQIDAALEQKNVAVTPSQPTNTELLLTEIRDLLKQNNQPINK